LSKIEGKGRETPESYNGHGGKKPNLGRAGRGVEKRSRQGEAGFIVSKKGRGIQWKKRV